LTKCQCCTHFWCQPLVQDAQPKRQQPQSGPIGMDIGVSSHLDPSRTLQAVFALSALAFATSPLCFFLFLYFFTRLVCDGPSLLAGQQHHPRLAHRILLIPDIALDKSEQLALMDAGSVVAWMTSPSARLRGPPVKRQRSQVSCIFHIGLAPELLLNRLAGRVGRWAGEWDASQERICLSTADGATR